MKNQKKIFVFLIIGILIGMSSIQNIKGEAEKNYNILNANYDAVLPIWDVGDSWTYKIDFEGTYGSSILFNFQINELIFEVTKNQNDHYILSITIPEDEITGSIFIDLDLLTLQGNLIDSEITGSMKVNKDNLGICHIIFDFDGYIDKAIDIPLNGHVYSVFKDEDWIDYNFSSLKFPLNVGDTWQNPQLHYGFLLTEFNLLPENYSTAFNLKSPTFKCTDWVTFKVNNIERDMLEIVRNSDSLKKLWYCPAVGNIIKLDYNMLDLDYGFSLDELKMELISTTYNPSSDPPVQPSAPAGPTTFIAGESGSYECFTTDPDDDIVKYIFNWGDGTTSSSDFIPSGEIVSITKQWTDKGTFDVKVKARDSYGKESEWSDSIEVTVKNIAPEKPSIPEGPTEGRAEQSYTYTTSSFDYDNHKIKYGWDWDGDKYVDDWTSYYSSGEQVSASNVWYTQAVYEIRVKAKDEFGEESEWSDPLTVTMPKERYHFIDLFNRILQRVQVLRLLLE